MGDLTFIDHPGVHVDEKPEKSFELVADRYTEDRESQRIRIHPWDRPVSSVQRDQSVYISLGWYSDDTESPMEDDDGGWINFENCIVDRGLFIEGLLEVFPELKRA